MIENVMAIGGIQDEIGLGRVGRAPSPAAFEVHVG
jgi:hypothetical protein